MNSKSRYNFFKKNIFKFLLFCFIGGLLMLFLGVFINGSSFNIGEYKIINPIMGLGFIIFLIPLTILGIFYTLAFISIVVSTIFSIFPFLERNVILFFITVALGIMIAIFIMVASSSEGDEWMYQRPFFP